MLRFNREAPKAASLKVLKHLYTFLAAVTMLFVMPHSTYVSAISLRSAAQAKESTILNLKGQLVSDDAAAFTIDLERSQVSHKKKVRFLMALKSTHQTIQAQAGSADNGETAFIALGDEPLQEQVLSEKRLATYFGAVQIGECVDSSKKPVECDQAKKDKLMFKMLFDTGSCEFWIPGIGCTKVEKYADRCSNHRTYDPLLSESYQNRVNEAGPFSEDQKMCIQYLSGKVEGFMARDTITIGDLKVNGQVFGMADTIDVPLLDEVVWDGIIGLAYPNQKLNKVTKCPAALSNEPK